MLIIRYVGLVLLLFCVHYNSKAQNDLLLDKTISLNVLQTDLPKVLQLITKQTGALFSYSPQLINVSKTVSIQVENQPLLKVLKQLFGNTVTIKQQGRYIILTALSVEEVIALQVNLQREANNLRLREELRLYKKIETISSGKVKVACHSCVLLNNNNMMRKHIAALMLTMATTATVSNQVSAQTEKDTTENKKPFQISFIYPLGTDGVATLKNTYDVSLNVLGGVNRGVKTFEFGGLFNVNLETVRGAQVAGLFNHSKKVDAYALQFAGLFNNVSTVGWNTNISQFAGISNYISKSDTKNGGSQFAGIANFVGKGENTFQAAGVTNIADNVVCQLAGVFNYAKKSQVQIGFFNYSDTANIMIGLINVAKNGYFEFEVASGDYLHTTASLRTGAKHMYGILSLGYNYNDKQWAIGGGIGGLINMKNNWGMNIEAVSFVMKDILFKENDTYQGLIQLRTPFFHKFGNRFKIFAGPVLNFRISDLNSKSTFASYKMFEFTNNSKMLEGWVGFSAGIRF